jgi:endonuclease-3
MAPKDSLSLIDAVATLKRRYKPSKPLSDPLQLILWENVGYLVSDEKRAALFTEFGERVGYDAHAIESAPHATLLDIAKRGGMRPEVRVERWREMGRLVLENAGGDLAQALAALPLVKARALLKKFPVIGDPGADKILLFSGVDARPSLDSNGLRVLVRLGLAREAKSYTSTYRNAVEALVEHGRKDRAWLVDAYLALQAHGRALCRRAGPECLPCPLDAVCAHVEYSEG